VSYQFDFSQLCSTLGELKAYEDPPNNRTYVFNLCGTSPRYCLPLNKGGSQQFVRGTMLQFDGSALKNPEACLDDSGLPTTCSCPLPIGGGNLTCTQDCEVLGVGSPIFSLRDSLNPSSGGINVTYTGVMGGEFSCPMNPDTGVPVQRSVTYAIDCDPSGDVTTFDYGAVIESPPCHYTLPVRTRAACGCTPSCGGLECGFDTCGNSCSGEQNYGVCPFVGSTVQQCIGGRCCRPDCGQDGQSSRRDCGSDGCGGSCGECGADEVCSLAHVCMQQSSAAGASAPVEFFEDGGPIFGAWLGGVVFTAALAAAVASQTVFGRELWGALRVGGLGEGYKLLLSSGGSSAGAGGYSSIGTIFRAGGSGSAAPRVEKGGEQEEEEEEEEKEEVREGAGGSASQRPLTPAPKKGEASQLLPKSALKKGSYGT
jgi:hypothetical protein